VLRKGLEGKAEIYHLDASKPTALVLAADFELRGRDIVFVDPAPIVRWNRVISMLLPSYGAIFTTRDMTR
jgi:polysaccharide export outer membrane protein